MSQGKPTVLIIGALPPPAIGPTIAMQRLITSQTLSDACNVIFVDTSDRREPDTIGRFDWMNLALGLKQAFECLWRLVTRWPDVVYLGVSQGTWGYLRDLAFIVPSMLLGRRVVIHLRGSEFRTFYLEMPGWLKLITRWVFRRAARVILLGGNLRKIFDGLVQPERLTVIPNGISYRMFFRNAEAKGDAPAGQRLLFLASLRRRKGLMRLLEAMPLVLSKFPEARLSIAGQWQDEGEKQEALGLVEKGNLAGKLTFLGSVEGEAKSRLFSEHDIFVFTPIEPEGLPWVVLEAMSSSLPVITTDQGAIIEVVEQDRTGFIIEPTPQNIAEKICRLIENPDEARRMGEAGRKRVEERFSEEAYLKSIVGVFLEEATPEASLARIKAVSRA